MGDESLGGLYEGFIVGLVIEEHRVGLVRKLLDAVVLLDVVVGKRQAVLADDQVDRDLLLKRAKSRGQRN